MGHKTAIENALQEILATIGEKAADGKLKHRIEKALGSGDTHEMRKVLHEFDRLDTAVIHRLREDDQA